MGAEFQLCKMRKFLEMEGGDGYTACTSRHYTLKNDLNDTFYVI